MEITIKTTCNAETCGACLGQDTEIEYCNVFDVPLDYSKKGSRRCSNCILSFGIEEDNNETHN